MTPNRFYISTVNYLQIGLLSRKHLLVEMFQFGIARLETVEEAVAGLREARAIEKCIEPHKNQTWIEENLMYPSQHQNYMAAQRLVALYGNGYGF